MKRFASILLLFALFCVLGCTQNAPQPKEPVRFYYPAVDLIYNGTTSIIQPELRESAGYDEDMMGLLNLYLQGPSSDTLRSPFPDHVTVVRYADATNTVVLELSNEFSQLVGIDLTIACACIANTVFDLTQLDRVQISVTDAQLDGQASIALDRGDIYYVDIPSPATDASDATVPPEK